MIGYHAAWGHFDVPSLAPAAAPLHRATRAVDAPSNAAADYGGRHRAAAA